MTTPLKRDERAAKPSDDMVVVAALLLGPRWVYADEVRGVLKRLGWTVTAQQVGAWLSRLAREESPMFEGHDEYGHALVWRVTRFGKTQTRNRFPGGRFEIKEEGSL